jgi:hypothetical protein
MAAFANSYPSDDYIYRFSPSQNCEGVFDALNTCIIRASSLKEQKYEKSFSFLNQNFNIFNPDDCTNIKMLKLDLYDKNKTALIFERSTYSTSSPYTIKIDNSGKSISMKQTVS